MQAQLNELGIRHFDDFRSLNAADLKTLNERLGLAGRIEQENWLGQAQVLATGGETYYSRRLAGSAAAPLRSPPLHRRPASPPTPAPSEDRPRPTWATCVRCAPKRSSARTPASVAPR